MSQHQHNEELPIRLISKNITSPLFEVIQSSVQLYIKIKKTIFTMNIFFTIKSSVKLNPLKTLLYENSL